jgi:hypothetical protein
MAFTPISNTVPQYSALASGSSAAGYYLKFYADGTTTPISMATDSAGGTLLAKCELDSLGYPTTDGTNIFIPHIDQTYKLALYTNATDADNNTLASAVWVVDDLEQSGDAGLREELSASNGTSLITHTEKGIDYTLSSYLAPITSTKTVSIPTDYADMQTALETESSLKSDPDINVIINIETGHAITGGLNIRGGDYSRFEITSTDATVSLSGSFVGADTSGVPAGVLGGVSGAPLFFGYGCKMPKISAKFDMGNLYGTGYQLAEAEGFVNDGAGVINAGYRGAQINGRANLYGADFSGANGTGLRLQQASSVCARNGVYDNCCKTVDTSSSAVYVSRSSALEFRGGSATGSGGSGLIARRSIVTADEAVFDSAADKGVEAENCAQVSFASGSALSCASNALNCVANASLYAVGASMSTTSSADNIRIATGGTVTVAGSTTIEGSSGPSNAISETDGPLYLNGYTAEGMLFYAATTEEIIPFKSVTAGITANIGSSQGDGPLVSAVNEISVCANAGDAVTLRAAKAGLQMTVINNGANACDVFPNTNDNLGAGVNVAVSLAAGDNITYVAYDNANWVSL